MENKATPSAAQALIDRAMAACPPWAVAHHLSRQETIKTKYSENWYAIGQYFEGAFPINEFKGLLNPKGKEALNGMMEEIQDYLEWLPKQGNHSEMIACHVILELLEGLYNYS